MGLRNNKVKDAGSGGRRNSALSLEDSDDDSKLVEFNGGVFKVSQNRKNDRRELRNWEFAKFLRSFFALMSELCEAVGDIGTGRSTWCGCVAA